MPDAQVSQEAVVFLTLSTAAAQVSQEAVVFLEQATTVAQVSQVALVYLFIPTASFATTLATKSSAVFFDYPVIAQVGVQ
jgi:hypothetical protein